MTDNFHIEWLNLPEWVYRMKGADRVISEEMVTSIDRMTIEGEGIAKRLVATDTRHLQRSIAHERARMVGRTALGRWGTNVPYGEVVEKGRGAGKPMPPAGALRGWMGRHGFPASAEFALRRKIGSAGIKARPYIAPSLAQVKAKMPAEMRACMSRIIARLGGGR